MSDGKIFSYLRGEIKTSFPAEFNVHKVPSPTYFREGPQIRRSPPERPELEERSIGRRWVLRGGETARRAIVMDAIDVAVDMETADKTADPGDDHVRTK